MKIFKLLFVFGLFFFITSCATDDHSTDVAPVFKTDIEASATSRADCNAPESNDCCDFASLLENFRDNVIAARNANNPQANSDLWDSWRVIACVIDNCNGGFGVNCSFYPGTCSDIGTAADGISFDDGCPNIINMAYCRLNCYMREYVTTPTDVGLVNIKVALCDYVLNLRNCGQEEDYNNRCPGSPLPDLSTFCGL